MIDPRSEVYLTELISYRCFIECIAYIPTDKSLSKPGSKVIHFLEPVSISESYYVSYKFSYK